MKLEGGPFQGNESTTPAPQAQATPSERRVNPQLGVKTLIHIAMV
jgi:hypothetical protein